jgi:hypothetical protein
MATLQSKLFLLLNLLEKYAPLSRRWRGISIDAGEGMEKEKIKGQNLKE